MGPLQRTSEILGRDGCEFESCFALTSNGGGIHVNYGILKAADAGHYRNRSIPQGTKLGQAARLEPRGNDQRIGTSLDQVR